MNIRARAVKDSVRRKLRIAGASDQHIEVAERAAIAALCSGFHALRAIQRGVTIGHKLMDKRTGFWRLQDDGA